MLHQIGSGVLGPVFRAYDSQNDRLAAVKTFKLMLVPEDAARLAERLRALVDTPPAHRAIIRGVEAGLDRSTPFLALEYAPGESLDVMLRQSGAWPAARALPVLREVAASIDASWATGTGHGALHPRDIYVAFAPTDIRVTGFGICQALEAVGQKPTVRRPYSAPERGAGPWDIRADVYSLGVVAFEMLSGQRPVGPDDEASALAASMPADARAAVRRVLTVAMADAPDDRHETATAFVDALASVALQGTGEPPPLPVVQLVDESELADEAPPAEEIAAAPPAVPEPATPEPPAPAPALVVSEPARVAPEPPVATKPVPEPASAPAPSVRVTAPASRAPIDLPLRSSPPPERPRPALGSFLQTESEPEPDASSSFPWAAVAAVFVAGLVLSGVVMYQWGWSRGHASAIAGGVQSATPSPSPTAVASSLPEPVASPSATPTPALAAKGDTTATREAPPVGRLVIQSVPAGAIVTLDGRRKGETPVTLEVPLGKHEIQIARSGYVPRIERVELTKKAAARTLRVTLQRPPAEGATATATSGSADVDSQPRGARVSIDGKFVGVSPMRVSDLSPGKHQFQFELAGHKTATSVVNIVAGERTRVTVTLVAGEARQGVEWGAGR